jgi:O-antigen/teichoic acid export membrane protein
MAALAEIPNSAPPVRARLARNTLWSVAGSVCSQGSSLLAALVVARILGVAPFGQLALIQATVLMLGTFSELGMTLTTTKFVSRWRIADPERTGRLIGWSLRIAFLSASATAVMLAFLGPHIGLPGAALSTELQAAGALLVFETLNRVQFGALAGLLMLPCVWIGTKRWGLPGAVAALALVSLAAFCIGHRVLRKRCRPLSISIGYSAAFERGVLSTSLSLWISALLMSGTGWMVTFLLSRNPAGFSELGLYNAADKWRTALLFLPNLLFQVTLPMLSSNHAAGDHRGCKRIVLTSLASTVGVTGIGAIVVILFSRLLMSSYGSAFVGGANVLSLGALVAVVSAVYTVGSSALWALGKPTQMVRLDLFKTALIVGLCWLGLAGSAWKLMAAYLVTYGLGSAAVLLAVARQLAPQRVQQVGR